MILETNTMSWIDQRPDDAMDGAFSAVAADHIPTADAGQFRQAMSRLGAAVHVITTAGPAGLTAMTATAACSVSDQPPTLLICVNKRAQSAPILSGNGVFCVNTLRFGQESIADFFAKRDVDKPAMLQGAEWAPLVTGAPVLSSAVAAFDCRITGMKSVGSHNVIFGAVQAVHIGTAGPALVYYDRSYRPV